MKKIKRLLMLSLVFSLSLTLCACVKDDNKETITIDGEEIVVDMSEEIIVDELDRGYTASYDDLSEEGKIVYMFYKFEHTTCMYYDDDAINFDDEEENQEFINFLYDWDQEVFDLRDGDYEEDHGPLLMALTYFGPKGDLAQVYKALRDGARSSIYENNKKRSEFYKMGAKWYNSTYDKYIDFI